MARTISTSVIGPVIITRTDNLLTITSTGSVTSTGRGKDGVDSGPAYFAAVDNAGKISASGGVGVSLAVGGVTNSGTISGTSGVVLASSDPGNVTNSGTISGLSASGAGVNIGGTFGGVANAGVISGGADGVILSHNGIVTNTGIITGGTQTSGIGVYLTGSGTVTNTHGFISGGEFGVFIAYAGTVTNSGAIDGQYGIAQEHGGTVTNLAASSIDGQTAGVFFSGAAGTLANSGVISGVAAGGTGADFESGGSVTNNVGGSIEGNGYGVFVAGGTGAVMNSGAITGSIISANADSVGVNLASGGTVTNTSGGSISGERAGVYFGATGTLTNSGAVFNLGTVTPKGGAGAYLAGGGAVANSAGGSIAGNSYGVFVTGGAGTVTNAGTISGGDYSVYFATNPANRLVFESGAVFNGAVDGGGGTLELAIGNVGTAGIGTGMFDNFQTLVVDPGGSWTLNGPNTIANVTNAGIAAVTGSLDVSTAINSTSTGLFQLYSGATLEVNSALGALSQMTFLASSELVIDHSALFGTNVGAASYAGSLLENFASGDTIDIKNFSSAGAAFNFNSSSGLLQISNGSHQVASLDFQTSSLGSGTFHLTADQHGGVLLTHG